MFIYIILVLLYLYSIQKQSNGVVLQKVAFKNFTKVTRKRLGWSFFLSSTSKFIKIETLAQVLANFCDFFKSIPFNGPPLVAASLHHNMQSIKIHKGSYMQWALCLSVSRANGATGFYLLQRHI